MNDYNGYSQNNGKDGGNAENRSASGEYHVSYHSAGQNATHVDPYGRIVEYGMSPKPGKKEKKFGLGLLALLLCTALLSALLSSGLTAALMKNSMEEIAEKEAQALIADERDRLEELAGQGGSGNVTNITVNEESDSIAEAVAQKVLPSTVGIKVSSTKQVAGFFGQSYSAQSSSSGSGVIYRENGYIITNYHVISDAVDKASYGTLNEGAKIEVYFYNEMEKEYPATVVGYDSSADIALLKVERVGLPAVEIGNSAEVTVGQTAIAIGCPGGLEFMGSVSKGIISGLDRTIATESGVEMNLVQTDAAINPGNSGGALVNSEGKLIGINNAKISGSSYEGMGFAIPVNEVVEICDRLINNEDRPDVYLGVTINTYYDASRLKSMGYPAGVVVYSVAEGSPAAVAGIQANDIITEINGEEITSYAAMISEKNKYDAGTTIPITIYRGRESQEVKVTLGEAK